MRKKGLQLEDLAAKHLMAHGLRVLSRNFHCRQGEIDIVLRDGQTLVFAEVRCRNNLRFGTAVESVTASKQRRIIRAARHYIAQHCYDDQACRFDVIGIHQTTKAIEFNWIRDAFDTNTF